MGETPATDVRAVGIAGLGVMGGAIGLRLLDLGWDVVGYDVDPAARASFGEAGGRLAGSPAQLCGATTGLVVVLVRTAEAAHDVVAGEAGIAGGERDVLVVVMSTIGPSAARRIARDAGEHVHVLDAPVSGGVARAEEGTLAVIVSGRDDDRRRAQPLFEAVGKTTVVVGDEPGAAQAAKLVNQAVMGTTMAAVAEGVRLAQRLGLDEKRAIEALASGTAQSWVVDQWDRLAQYWDPSKPADSLGLVAMDMRLALDELASTGVSHGFPLVGSAYRELVRARDVESSDG